ncbi:cytochrome P450, partial [Actinobacteria bacterium OK074]
PLRLPLPHGPNPLDPPPVWEELRSRCPVATVELPSGDKGTYLTRYADVRALLSDPRFSRPTAEDDSPRLAPGGAGRAATDGGYQKQLPQKGEPHQKWRRQVGRYFTAKRMSALRPGMTAMTESLVDDLVAGGRPGDLKATIGFPLPVYVICTLLGAPVEERDRFSHWSDAFLNVTRYSADETRAAHAEFTDYMTALVAAKRARPGDDLLSMLITEGEGWDGAGLPDEDLVSTGMGLLVAGHETTANMIGKMVGMLLVDRTRWERLLADRSLIRTAVEESLRFDALLSGFGMRRYLTEDVELEEGTLLPGGTTVFCAMAAANRDERAFTDAAEMDLTRTPNPHIAFGAGPHSCLGQALARTELQVVLEVLLRRLPTLELAVPNEELKRVEGLLVGGLREVPVRW